MTVAIRRKHFAQQQSEVVFDVPLGVHIRIRRHRIELELLLQHLLYVLSETPAHLLFPSQLHRRIRPRIQGNDKKKINVVMGDNQRISVKQAILKLPRHQFRAFSPFDASLVIFEILIHACTDEKIRNNIIPFRHIIPQFRKLLAIFRVLHVIIQEYIQIPLNDISRIGKLLGDGFRSDTVPHLVILAITDVIDVPILFVVVRQTSIGIHVVDNLAVFLVLESVRQVLALVTDQLVNHRLEDNIEVLGQEIFFTRRRDRNPVALVKERVAKFPERQHLVRKILVLDLHEPRFAIARQIPFKLRRWNQLVIELGQNRKPILVLDISQNRIEDAKKLLLLVYFLLAVDDRSVDRGRSVHKNRLFLGDSLGPVDPVVPAVLQLRDEHEEVAIALLKIDQRQYNVQERVAKPFASPPHLRNILVQNDIARGIRRLEN